ncbi:hypothetical protein ATE67_16155 [Sphingopyxis sp. H050]|uniref:hypothetical protein n=1 Tax=Sphingopyxis sp. H050 TaxID=1759072 RepID=UPI00073644F8|nr:hypothetical protein [Sphingopyxis sp. H050]KTE19068.1 hypothetical protein ATE67_16155 [Sphingopyxis sp. H050]
MTTGYSGTPLAKKLSLKDGMSAWFHAMPGSLREEIGAVTLDERDAPKAGLQAAHIFTTERAELETLLTDLRTLISPAGFVWVSWPKRTSKVPSDITEDVIRTICLPMGWVDVKVCAVDATWSGLKLMIRKELR